MIQKEVRRATPSTDMTAAATLIGIEAGKGRKKKSNMLSVCTKMRELELNAACFACTLILNLLRSVYIHLYMHGTHVCQMHCIIVMCTKCAYCTLLHSKHITIKHIDLSVIEAL